MEPIGRRATFAVPIGVRAGDRAEFEGVRAAPVCRSADGRVAYQLVPFAELNARIFGRVECNRIEETQPRLNSRVTMNYQKKALGFEVQHAYFGTIILRPGIFQYSGFSPFGFNGRFSYLRLSYRM